MNVDKQDVRLIDVNALEEELNRWLHRRSWDKFVCSACSFEQDDPTKYCPHCGAKMEE